MEACFLGKSFEHRKIGAHDVPCVFEFVLHMRKRVGHKRPWCVSRFLPRCGDGTIGVDDFANCALGVYPLSRAALSGGQPIPIVAGRVKRLTGAGGEVGVEAVGFAWKCDLSRFLFHHPRIVCIDESFGVRVALYEKGGAVAHLRYRRVDAKIPDCR